MSLQQTPAHEIANEGVLALIPPGSCCLIEIGCSSGALAREFKKINPAAHYRGVDIVADYAELARRHCDEVMVMDIEQADATFFAAQRDRDCWIFADALEHLSDPWSVLRRIREVIPGHGQVVACIPNAQNWALIAKLCVGEFRYEDSGLLDRTHLRFFTRKTMIELFRDAGFEVAEANSRIYEDGLSERFLPLVAAFAKAAGVDPQLAMGDAVPFQYILRATPA